jgi:hypothetical protein
LLVIAKDSPLAADETNARNVLVVEVDPPGRCDLIGELAEQKVPNGPRYFRHTGSLPNRAIDEPSNTLLGDTGLYKPIRATTSNC